MKTFNFGDLVISGDGFIGIVCEYQTLTDQYFIRSERGGRLYYTHELMLYEVLL